MRILPPSIIGITTLGLASVISTSNGEEKKKEIPNIPLSTQVKGEEKTNKKEIVLDNLSDINHVDLAYKVLEPLSQEERVKLAKKIFTETKNALVNNTANLKTQEKCLLLLLNAIPANYKSLKDILPACKNEYKDLIGAYINALSNPEHKREKDKETSARFNALILANLLADRGDMNIHTIPKLFNEKWYPEIEKIINRIDKEFKLDLKIKHRYHSVFAVAELAKLELRKDNGIKSPKVYFKLLDILDKNLEQNWSDVSLVIQKCIMDEAFMNDNPPESRIRKYKGEIVRVKVDTSLTKPFEKILSRILSKLPEDSASELDKKRYEEAFRIAKSFFKGPAYTDNPECIIAWQEPILNKIAKAKPDDIPKLLTDFRNLCDTDLGELNPSYDKHREIYQAGAKHLKPILEIGCKHLLDKSPENNTLGISIIQRVRNAYSEYGPVNFAKDKDIKKLILQVLTQMQKEEFKTNHAFLSHLDSTIEFLHLTWNEPDVVRETAKSLTAQVNHTYKTKNKTPQDKKEVESIQLREVELLKATSSFTGWMWSTYGTRFKEEEIAKNIEPLYRDIGEKILKDSSSPEVLNNGRELIRLLHRFLGNDEPQDEASKKFVETAVDITFRNLLESSSKLPPDKREVFLESFRKDALSWPLRHVGKKDIYTITKIATLFSNHYFNSKTDKDLKQFSQFMQSEININNFWSWHPVVVLEMVRVNKDYLNITLKESIKNAQLNNPKQDLTESEHLVTYLQFLAHAQNLLKDSRTTFYPKENAKEVESFIKDSSIEPYKTFINKLNTEKVIVEKSQTTPEHTIYDKHFELYVKGLKAFVSIYPNQAKDCIDVINKRLSTEKEPHVRGMLYKAIFNIAPDFNVTLNTSKKSIVIEQSPLIAQTAGEVLAEQVLDELLSGQSKDYILHGNVNSGIRRNDINKLKLDDKIKTFNERLDKAIKEGTVIPNEKTQAQDFLLNCVLYGQGGNIESLLKETLDESLVKKLNANKNEKLDPEIIKAAIRVLNNSNIVLSACVGKLHEETKHLISNDKELLEFIPEVKKLHDVGVETKKTASNVINLLENRLRWTGTHNMPYTALSLVLLYSNQNDKLEEYNKNIDRLATRLFKGTNEKLAMDEQLQVSLGSKYIWKYLENCRAHKNDFTKEELAQIETNCRAHIKQLDGIFSIKDLKQRENMLKDFERETSILDPKLYTDIVRTPLKNYRLKFLEVFIEFAPSGQRREYISMVLDSFGLRNRISEVDLRKIVWGED